MWWLIIPVLIYSAGLSVLWLILINRNGAEIPAVAGRAGRSAGAVEEAAACAAEMGAGAAETVIAGPVGIDAGAAEAATAVMPKITIVVAARNEEQHITRLLESLVKQDYPGDLLEIIIVNDNSTDRTPIVVSEFKETIKDQEGLQVRLVFNPFPGKKRAIRYGIEKASGEVIITTDADCTVGPEWVRRHASWYKGSEPGLTGSSRTGFTDSGTTRLTGSGMTGQTGSNTDQGSVNAEENHVFNTAMVLAPVFQRPPGGFWSLFGIFEFSALQALTEATAVAGHPVMCNAANMSFRRDVYMRHSGDLRPDLASGDDMFLLHAVMRDGGTVRHDGSTAAAVETAAAVTAAALLHQRARWASKTFHYRDAATLTLAAATAACNAAVTAAAAATFISVNFLPAALTFYAAKAIPDLLLVAGELRKRGIRLPVIPFIISELIYPFYFMTVAVASRFPSFTRFRTKR
jgi:glycosyltransferase involved in cell wall biosynthesis